MAEKTLTVRQVKSAIGSKPKHRGTLRALGLGRIGKANTLPDTPSTWGMIQRVPKLKGFKNPFRVEYVVINLDALSNFEGSEINPGTLRSAGLIPKQGLLKVLGGGSVSKSIRVRAHAFSKSAEAAITSAGGS